MQGDGNCLYRSFADQLYGEENVYEVIKKTCFDYIEIEKDFFSQYIEGGLDNFDYYIAMKRRDGVWGDDVEIQALSEIYGRNIQIYSHSLAPLKTFHENEQENTRKIERAKENFPIRLSYHGRAHYNSIVPCDENLFKQALIHTHVGKFETKAIEIAKERVKQEKEFNERKNRESAENKDKIILNDVESTLLKENSKIEAARGNFNEKSIY